MNTQQPTLSCALCQYEIPARESAYSPVGGRARANFVTCEQCANRIIDGDQDAIDALEAAAENRSLCIDDLFEMYGEMMRNTVVPNVLLTTPQQARLARARLDLIEAGDAALQVIEENPPVASEAPASIPHVTLQIPREGNPPAINGRVYAQEMQDEEWTERPVLRHRFAPAPLTPDEMREKMLENTREHIQAFRKPLQRLEEGGQE